MQKLIALFIALFIAVTPSYGYRIGIKKFGHNYFGTGNDGVVTISSNTNLTSTTDGDFVIKEYDTLTVNSGVTLTTSNRCKGLIIYVKNNCTVNGTITMTDRGPNLASPSEGIFSPRHVDASGVKGLITDYSTPATGAAGGGDTAVVGNGNAGSAGASGGTGGGGGGAGGLGGVGQFGIGKAGSAGTCFGGGAGGGAGGIDRTTNTGNTGTAGGSNGGAGGNAGTNVFGSSTSDTSSGGAGNNGGTSSATAGTSATAGSDGVGGSLYLIVGGNLTIGAAGVISANGSASGSATGNGTGVSSTGGGSAGGKVVVLYAGTLSNSGTVQANGGAAGAATGSLFNRTGGAGGAGTVTGPTKVSKE